MGFDDYRAHFQRNAERPLPPVAARPTTSPDRLCDGTLPRDLARTVARSLALFQVGEAGEGRLAKEIDRVVLRGVDDAYREALKLFIREEGRHARILASLVRGLGGETLKQTMSERLFVHGRRVLGIRTKLLALFVAEVIGIGFYHELADRLPSGSLTDALREIAADEEVHLRFHATFFHETCGSDAARVAAATAFLAVTAIAVTIVVIENRTTLRTLNAGPALVRRYRGLSKEAIAQLFSPGKPPQAARASLIVTRAQTSGEAGARTGG